MKNVDFRNGQPLIMMVSQYDYGYNLQLALWTNGEAVTIAAAKIVSENFTVACSVSGNVVTIPVTTSMTEQFGHFPAELRVTDSLGQVSSKNFDWFVERSPLAVKSTQTYSGDIVEFTAKRVPLNSVVVTMEPIQDLNGYDSPWPAGGGKNKLDINNRPSSSNDHILICNCSLEAGTYTISATVESTSPSETCLVLFIYDDNTNSGNAYLRNNTRSSATLTATKKVKEVRFYSATNYGTSQNHTIQLSNAQIESGSSATTYDPYSNICPITGRTGASVLVNSEYSETGATTYPITFTSAGTVYAGTVDLVSGVLTVTHGGYTFTGDDTFGMNGGNTNIIYFNGNSLTRPMKSGTWIDDASTKCSHFEKVISNADFGIRFGANSKYIYFYQMLNTLGIASIADWKTWLASNNVQITYPLETPFTYTLTPTQVMSLLGENIVWSPDGEVTVVVPEYY